MKSVIQRINLYLLVGLVAGFLCACETAEQRKRRKELTTVRLHLETNPDDGIRTAQVPVFRERPVLVTIEKAPFLDEGSLVRAWVEDSVGGFVIKLEFESSGKLMLDGTTASNRGRRIVVYCGFPEVRWLAAPMIQNRIADGVFSFTPDASREEAERIVRGLNNVAAQAKKNSLL